MIRPRRSRAKDAVPQTIIYNWPQPDLIRQLRQLTIRQLEQWCDRRR